MLSKLEKILGYTFRNRETLNLALTHTSYVNEEHPGVTQDNERLEFLGDAVINFIISDYIYHLQPELDEGKLAKLKAVVVSEAVLARQARAIKLGEFLRLGKGELRSGGASRASILGDAFEAVVGAMYLDGGIEITRQFILSQLQSTMDAVLHDAYTKDYKSLLQELAQSESGATPRYEVVRQSGPDHNKLFVVKVTIRGLDYGMGKGKSKKEAEQKAARMGFRKLRRELRKTI
ncbi:MAG: ribonuclease III [bacterium]|nr:ribonuclease III [bacterium]